MPVLYLKKTMLSLRPIDLSKKSKKNLKSPLIPEAVSNDDDESQWEKLERRMNRDHYPTLTLSDFSTATQAVRLTKGRFVCVIGGMINWVREFASPYFFNTVTEPVHLVFDWRNVLQVPLPINNIFLECETDSSKMDKSLWPLSGGLEPPERLETADFDVEVLPDLALDANERRRVLFFLELKTNTNYHDSFKSGSSPSQPCRLGF